MSDPGLALALGRVSELRDWAQGVEAIGCDFISMADHVIYAYARDDRPQTGPYTDDVHQHEVLTTLAWIAAHHEPRRTADQRPCAAPTRTRSGRQAGGRSRHPLRWPNEARHRHRLAMAGVRRAKRKLPAAARAGWRSTSESFAPAGPKSQSTFSGRYVNIDNMSVMPKPVTPGGPPILFGGLCSSRPSNEPPASATDGSRQSPVNRRSTRPTDRTDLRSTSWRSQ